MSGKIASMKVQVSADTRQFDSAMQRVRGQMKGVAKGVGAVGSVTGMPMGIGGKLGGLAGLAGLSPAMLGVTAAVSGLSMVVDRLHGAVEQFNKARDEAKASAAAVIDSRLDPVEQMRLQAAAGVVSPGATSADLLEFLRGFTDDKLQMRLMDAGMTQTELDAVTKGNAEAAIRILADLSRSARGAAIGEAIGGKAGVMFNQARFATPEMFDKAFRGKIDQRKIEDAIGMRRSEQMAAAGGSEWTFLDTLNDWLNQAAAWNPLIPTLGTVKRGAGQQAMQDAAADLPLATGQFSPASAEANQMPAEVVQLLRESVAVQKQIRDGGGGFN